MIALAPRVTPKMLTMRVAERTPAVGNRRMTVFTSKILYTPLRKVDDGVVSVENGAVVNVASRTESAGAQNKAAIDFGDCVIAPGFFDIHVHLREPGTEEAETIATGGNGLFYCFAAR